jgi:hypothetical protein
VPSWYDIRVSAATPTVDAASLCCCAGDVQDQAMCSKKLAPAEVAAFKKAINDRYWFQLFMGSRDELAVTSFLTRVCRRR